MPEYTPPSGGGGGIDGTLSANRVSFASDSDTLTDDADFTYDSTNDVLTVTKVKAQNIIEVENATGSAIPAGSPVYVSAIGTGKPQVALADADDSSKMPSLGIVTNQIANGASGYVAINGQLNGLDRTVASGPVADADITTADIGKTLYVSTTAGKLTVTKPTGVTSQIQNVGIIIDVSGSNFKMQISNIGRANDVPNGLGEVVRYGLTSNKSIGSGARYTFTSAEFTAHDENTDVVTFSGTSVTLKGAGTFDIKLYGYFAAGANLATLGPQIINPPGDPASTQTAVSNIQAKLDEFIENELEFDLSIGSTSTSNLYAYNRNIINMGDSVVRFSQFTTATIVTTADTVINLSGYIVWPQAASLIATSASGPQYTGFTITKVA